MRQPKLRGLLPTVLFLLSWCFALAATENPYQRCRTLVAEQPDIAEDFCMSLLQSDDAKMDAKQRSYVYNDLAALSTLRGDYLKAERYLDDAITKMPLLHKKNIFRFNWLRKKGFNQYKQDNFQAALPYMLDALDVATHLAHDGAMATSYNDVGATYMELGRYLDALEMLEKSIQHLEKVNRLHSLGLTLANIGLIYRDLGQFNQSIDYYTRAIKAHSDQLVLTPAAKFTVREYAHNFEERGITYLHMGQLESASQDLQYALNIYQQHGFVAEQIRTLAAEARFELLADNPQIALTKLREAQTLEQIEGQWQSLEVRRELVATHSKLNDFETAAHIALQGLALANEKQRFVYQLSFLKQLADLSKKTQQFAQSLDYLNQYLILYEKYIDQKNSPQIADLQAVIEVQQQQKEIELLELDKRNYQYQIQQQVWIITTSSIIIVLFLVIFFLVFWQRKKERKFLHREINFHKSELERLAHLDQEDEERPIEENSTSSQMEQLDDTTFGQMLVAIMCDCIDIWEQTTGTNSIELAEKSKIWAVVIDNGRLRARTMDKYTDIRRLPKSPRWRQVVRTCRYVLINCQLNSKQRELLNQALDELLDYQKKQATSKMQ